MIIFCCVYQIYNMMLTL